MELFPWLKYLYEIWKNLDGEAVRLKKTWTIKNFAYRDEFIPQGGVCALQKEYGVDCEQIEAYILGILQ